MSDSYAFPAYEPDDVIEFVVRLLKADTAFMTACPGGVWPEQGDSGITLPYAVVDSLASTDNRGNTGYRYMNTGLVIVTAWGKNNDKTALKTAMVRADAALSDKNGSTETVRILRLLRAGPLKLPPDNRSQPTWYRRAAQWDYQAQALAATA